ncbi:MAG: hypothetical protein O6945_04955 [Gammaproteobacteria bacterium]|nr:hypothetical protein [Gammaproteobacteria bacterium]
MSEILKTYLRNGNWDHLGDSPQRDPEPDDQQIMDWLHESGCEATDGCWVEHDGTCPHGKQSWFLELGLI